MAARRARSPIGVRWTIGDVSPAGFEALRLSIAGAFRLFGGRAEYVVCCNSIPVDRARELIDPLPAPVRWEQVSSAPPRFLARLLDGGMAEGVAWKLVPLQRFPDRHELALDNDVILWSLPPAIADWLGGDGALLAEDVRTCFGAFADLCGPLPRNTGIRSLPPAFDLARAMAAVLDDHPHPLRSELDEQGLQVAAITRAAGLLVVPTEDVSICSPFPPHQPELGRCGAHFVGLNPCRLPFEVDGRPGEEVRLAHFHRHLPELRERVGLAA